MPHLDLKNIKRPREVKELIYRNVEDAKDRRRMRTTELVGDGMDGDDDFHDTCEMDDEDME